MLPALLLVSVSLIAQDAPIPQNLPQRQPKLLPEVMTPRAQPPRPPLGWLQNRAVAPAPVVAVPNRSVEDRIAALEAKIAALQSEIEAQRALIRQLEERLEQQKNK